MAVGPHKAGDQLLHGCDNPAQRGEAGAESIGAAADVDTGAGSEQQRLKIVDRVVKLLDGVVVAVHHGVEKTLISPVVSVSPLSSTVTAYMFANRWLRYRSTLGR